MSKLDPPVTPGMKINYGAGRKVSDDNYGSYDFHCSMPMDVTDKTTALIALKACAGFVEEVLEKQVHKAKVKGFKY